MASPLVQCRARCVRTANGLSKRFVGGNKVAHLICIDFVASNGSHASRWGIAAGLEGVARPLHIRYSIESRYLCVRIEKIVWQQTASAQLHSSENMNKTKNDYVSQIVHANNANKCNGTETANHNYRGERNAKKLANAQKRRKSLGTFSLFLSRRNTHAIAIRLAVGCEMSHESNGKLIHSNAVFSERNVLRSRRRIVFHTTKPIRFEWTCYVTGRATIFMLKLVHMMWSAARFRTELFLFGRRYEARRRKM